MRYQASIGGLRGWVRREAFARGLEVGRAAGIKAATTIIAHLGGCASISEWERAVSARVQAKIDAVKASGGSP